MLGGIAAGPPGSVTGPYTDDAEADTAEPLRKTSAFTERDPAWAPSRHHPRRGRVPQRPGPAPSRRRSMACASSSPSVSSRWFRGSISRSDSSTSSLFR